MSAMQKALDLIGDAFRPERKPYEQTLLQGHRVMALVNGGRYTFAESCKLLNVDEAAIGQSYFWLKEDQERIAQQHDHTIIVPSALDYELLCWFRKRTPTVLGNLIYLNVSGNA